MGKMLFIDLDDCMVESSTLIQRIINERTRFKSADLAMLDFKVSNLKEIFERNKKEIARAYVHNEKPRVIGCMQAGSNDIFKSSSNKKTLTELEKEKQRIYHWYKEPYEISEKAYNDAFKEKEMFLEERDNFLETDNQLREEYGVINYQDIYTTDYLSNGIHNLIKILHKSSEYSQMYCLSHHNGGREEYAKRTFIERNFPELTFLGLRFHLDRYEKGKRRPRSSKALHVMKKFNLRNLNNCILIDDSTVNLDEWVKYGGIAILYRPISFDEEYFNVQEPHNKVYPRITKMDIEELNKALAMYQEDKKILKK